jgi:hypothetical protein
MHTYTHTDTHRHTHTRARARARTHTNTQHARKTYHGVDEACLLFGWRFLLFSQSLHQVWVVVGVFCRGFIARSSALGIGSQLLQLFDVDVNL